MTVYGKITNGEFIPAPYGEIEDLIKQGYSAFTDEQAQSYINKKLFQEQIDELEKTQARSLREMITSPNDFARTKLQSIDAQITTLRAKIAEL